MNRAQRRAAGFRGPAYTHSMSDGRPRYVRRHLAAALSAPVNTRRVRKAKARILRHARRVL